jgi:hypothetical protein
MSQTWERFGFTESPYSTAPLESSARGAQLLAGRKKEGAQLLTMLDTKRGATVVLSGNPGVGKTSFFNVYQYWIAKEEAGDAPIIVPAIKLTPILNSDTVEKLAQRIVNTTAENIRTYCITCTKPIPPQTKKIIKWLSPNGSTAGLSFSISILGTGGGVGYDLNLPPVGEATFETWQDVLRALSVEASEVFSADGIFVCLDNAETVSVDELAKLLMAFRDTFFMLDHVWWMLIGQSRLFDLLAAKDRRISERLRGGVEIAPLGVDDLHAMIELRIQNFRHDEESVSPLSKDIHSKIFDASQGVARFALKAAEDLVNAFVSDIRNHVHEAIVGKKVAPEVKDQILLNALESILFKNQLKDELALKRLHELAVENLQNSNITSKEVDFLEMMMTNTLSLDEIGATSGLTLGDVTELIRGLVANGHVAEVMDRNRAKYRARDFAYLCASLGGYEALKCRMASM